MAFVLKPNNQIARIARLSGIFDNIEKHIGLHPAVVRWLKLVTIMAFSAHLIACVLMGCTQCVEGDGFSCWVEVRVARQIRWISDPLEFSTAGSRCAEPGRSVGVQIRWSFPLLGRGARSQADPLELRSVGVFSCWVEVRGARPRREPLSLPLPPPLPLPPRPLPPLPLPPLPLPLPLPPLPLPLPPPPPPPCLSAGCTLTPRAPLLRQGYSMDGVRPLAREDQVTQYLATLYFAFATMTTIG